jgi:hypothetical protein
MRRYRTKKTLTEASDGTILDQSGSDGVDEQVTREAVSKLAYEYWLKRGCPDGSAAEDWFQAERALQTGAKQARPETGLATADSGKDAHSSPAGAVMRAAG